MNITTSRRGFIRTLTQTSATTAGVILLNGCGRKQNEAPQVKTEAKTLVCQLAWVKDAEFMGYFIAHDKGWYQESIPDLSVTLLAGGPDIIPEATLLSKRADIALTTPDTTVNLIVKDKAPLKIIGTQYHTSPLGVVSLKTSNINDLSDLIGKTIAVSPVTVLAFEALLKLNNIDKQKVNIVPYQYNVGPLLNGTWHATIDFVTNVPFTIKQKGVEPNYFLLSTKGFQVFNDTVVVTEETLRTRRKELIAWIRGSRRGWDENFIDPKKYPPTFVKSHFLGNGRTIENEIYFNELQMPLIRPAKGAIFSMTEEGIQANIDSLQRIGIAATRSMFDTELLKEASA